MSYSDILQKYCDDIIKGRIASCHETKQAVKRFINDLKRSQDEGYPFMYVQEDADRLLSFMETLKPGDLDGKTLKLLPWQIFILSNLEGWKYKDDPERKRFRTAYDEIPRKNGKTTGLLYGLVLYNFIKYKSSESYLVSSRDDLAEKTFKEIADIIHSDKMLDSMLDCKSLAITFKDIKEKSRLAFYCDGAKDTDGFKPRFCCLDEYHAFASDKMFTSMSYGMRSKKDAQLVVITTADVEVTGPCYEMSLKARNILNGVKTQEDFFCIIYTLDESDDYHDPAVWQKANPSLYDIIDPSVIQSDIDDAELSPHKLPELKAKTFNIWGGGGETSWLPVEVWTKNKDIEVDWNEFEGCDCYGGLDLAMVDDFCAFTLKFIKDGKGYYKHKFYIPADTVASRYSKENINIRYWIESGIVTATPGATVNYDFIVKDILDAAENYRIRALGYDKWQSKDVINALEEECPELLLVEIEQSMKKLSPATKSYEKAIRDGLVVDNNPVMVWMVNNCQVYVDENQNIKLKKKSKASTGHIDGVISSIMAHSLSENKEINVTVAPMSMEELKAFLS